jgi:AcrR family transcriptional regulator
MLTTVNTKDAKSHGRKPTGIRRTEIVDIAMGLLAERGARAFTAKAIADAVGVTNAAVFRHFPAMDAIVDAIVDRMESILFEGFPPQGDDPIARLGAFFESRVRAIREHPHLSRLLLSEHLAQVAGTDSAARIATFRERSQRFVVGCLREARRKDLLAQGVGPEDGAVLVLGAVLSMAHGKAVFRGGAPTARACRNVWSVLERALRGPLQSEGNGGRK